MIERYEKFTDSDAVESFKEEYRIDHPIVNTFEPLDKFSDRDVAVDLMRGYNNYLLDNVLDSNDDILGLAGIVLSKPEAAVEEIERLADEKQIVGAYVGNNGVNPPPGDPKYDAVYQALEDHGLPVVFHANADGFVYDFPVQNQGFSKYLECHALAHMWYQSKAVVSLITQGVPEKFPDLNIVILEAGLSWIPYVMFRLNREYAMRKQEAPLLQQSPEEYIRDSFYFASQPLGEPNNPDHFDSIINIIGSDSLLFASDYPHWDFDHPRAFDKHLRSQFTSEEREKILYKNPKEAFGLTL